MNILKQFTTYFIKSPAPPPKAQSPLMSSNSFEIITEDIIESCLRQEFLLLDDQKETERVVEQEAVENMYVKDYFLIGKKCEGSVMSLEVWKEIIKKSDLSIASKKDLYFSIFQGIDYRIRKEVWQLLANTSEMKRKTKLSFMELTDPAKLPKSELEAIDKDVSRTSGLTHSLKELRQILIAYANLSETNYTQGMNIIAGVLLRLLQIQNDKELEGHFVVEGELSERVFWVMVGVMKWKNWQQVFEKNLAGLHRMLGVLKSLMLDYVPEVLQLIESLEWDLGIFAQYYVTICLSHCPPDLAPIILDLFLLDGQNVVHSLLMRMLVVNKQKILGFKDECLLMKYLKSQMLSDTYQRLLKDRTKAKRLQDFEINFLRTTL